MKIEQKAKELIDKYLRQVFSGEYTPTPYSLECAKQCAIICCDELIDSYNKYTGMYDQRFFDSDLLYWQKVKEFILNS